MGRGEKCGLWVAAGREEGGGGDADICSRRGSIREESGRGQEKRKDAPPSHGGGALPAGRDPEPLALERDEVGIELEPATDGRADELMLGKRPSVLCLYEALTSYDLLWPATNALQAHHATD